MTDHKNFDELINRLGEDLSAGCTKMHCPAQRATIWFFTGIFSIILIGAFVGFRMDLADKIYDPLYISEILFAIVMSASAAYASAWLSLPEGCGRKIIILPYVLVSIAAGCLFYEFIYHEFIIGELTLHHCAVDAAAMGSVPLILMILMMRRGAPTRPVLSAMTNMVAAGSMGYLGMRLTCGNDQMGHVCTYHIFPYILAGLILGLLARRLYRW